MKKGFTITIALLLLLGLIACGGTESSNTNTDATELIVFAAASMSGVLAEIAEIYTDANPNVNIVFNFDSSGTLRTQIQQGAQADLFISAATRQMDELDINSDINTGYHDFVLYRADILENQVVLVASPDNLSGIESFEDMVKALLAGDVLMTMGNSDVPVGRYAIEVLAYFGLDHAKLASAGVISYGSNVREVSSQVREGSADIGIVYLTDAVFDELLTLDIADAEMTGDRVIYPAAVLNISENPDAAQVFLDFLIGDTAMEVFIAWGFTPYAD